MSMQADLANPEMGYSDEGLNLTDPGTFWKACAAFGQATALPPVAYRSKVFSELESEKIWTRSWVVIGLEQQIPNPGDLLPFTLGFHGIHVQRNSDGAISARMNRHQHGGCRFVPVQCRTGTQTKCSITSCNYTRDADVMPGGQNGENTDVMFKFVGLVPEKLTSIKCETWGPFIFVNLDPECEPLATQISDLTRRLGQKLDGTLTLQAKLWLDFKCNWKMMGAATMDCAGPIEDFSPDGVAEADATFAEGLFTSPDMQGLTHGGSVALPGVEEARLYWIFPNVLLAVCPTHVAVVLLQATSMSKTLCRFFLLDAAGMAEQEASWLAYQWIAFFKERGASAEALHNEATLRGTPARPDTSAEELPVETNFGSYLLNRFVARTVCTQHHYYWNAPIMDAAMLMRGTR